jgi:prevent-host-death family protein
LPQICADSRIKEVLDFLMDLVHDLVHYIAMEVNIHEAKTNFSKLLQRVALGEEIIIAKAGTPIAKLVPVYAEKPKRPLGLFKGQIWMAEDFNGPLPDDILAGFLGEELPPNKIAAKSEASALKKQKKTR